MAKSSRLWDSIVSRLGDTSRKFSRRKQLKAPKARSLQLEQCEDRLLLSIAPITGPASVDENELFTLTVDVTDLAATDTVTEWTIDWGDETVTVTPPASGDDWGNGVVQVDSDTWEFSHSYSDGSANYSVQVDAEITDALSNVTTLNTYYPIIPGDANMDGTVDGYDAAILAGNWQATDATWDMGDFNGDEIVNDADNTILSSHWQENTSSSNNRIVVDNVAPVLSLTGAQATVSAGGTHSATLSVSDAGDDTVTSITFDWGDGQTSVGTKPASGDDWGNNITRNVDGTWTATHTYVCEGTYDVTVSVVDEDGTWGDYQYQGNILVSTLTDESDTDYTNGDLSLREALYLASQNSGDDTIVFDTDLFNGGTTPGTITLGGSSLSIIVDSSSVTLEGPGADLLTIDADGQSSVFTIFVSEVNLSGMTITGGYSGDGGGIYNNMGTLTVADSVITGNAATGQSSSGGGAGIYSLSGTLSVTNSSISNNSILTGYYHGGGLSLVNTNASIVNTTITDNSANIYGGGLFLSGGNVHLINSTVAGNSVGSVNPNAGGGIYNYGDSATLELDNTIVALNAGYSKPDIFSTIATGSTNNLIGDGTDQTGLTDGVDGNQLGTATTPLDPQFANSAQGDWHLLVTSSAVNAGDNTAASGITTDRDGNARTIYQTVDIGAYEYNGDIVVSTLSDDDAVHGANDYTYGNLSLREALYLAEQNPGTDTIVFDDALFNGGSTPGTILLGGTELTVNNDVTITGPGTGLLTIDANDQSRVFYVTGAEATLSGMTVTGGSTSALGGGIYVESYSDLTINNLSVTDNATTNFGGGIYTLNSTLEINSSSISENEATNVAGIVGVQSTLLINYSIISDNTASAYGGIVSYNGTLEINDSTIYGNSASTYTGGIYLGGSTATIDRSLIFGNSGAKGAGLGLMYGTEVTITNSAIYANTASDSGGGIYTENLSSNSLEVINSTITANTAVTGGGIYITAGDTFNLANTIVAENTATTSDPDIYGSLTTDTNNLVGIWTDTSDPGDDTLYGTTTPLDPDFVDTSTNDYRLNETSPAINTGDNQTVTDYNLTTGLDGNMRIAYEIVDIGAYEYQPTVLYWDTNGATAGLGDGNGTWSTTDACWTTDPDGNIATQAWDNSGNYVAVFDETSGGAVTISGQVSAQSLQFLDSGYTLTGSASDSIALTGNIHSIYVDENDTATINAVLTGSDGLLKTGDGTLILTGTNSNTYTGGTTVNGGIFQAQKTAALPGYDTSGDVVVNDGGTLAVNVDGYSQWSTTNIDTLLSNATFNDGSVLGIDTSSYSFSYGSIIAGTLGLTKLGSGTLTLTGSNTYSGVTTISNGYLVIGYSNSTGTLGSGDVVIEADGELQFYRSSGNDMTVANDISGAGDLSLYGSDIVTLSGDSSYSGTTTIGSSSTLVVGSENGLGNSTVTSFSSGNLTFDSTTAITVDNDITGSVVVMQQGAGAVTLSGNNTYTGTTTVVTGTTLKAGSDTATGTGNMTLDGTFDLNGYDPTIGALNGSGVVTTTDTGLSTLTVGYGSAYGTFSGILQDGSGTLGLTKIGTNYQYLTGSNTYSGVTTISNGYLVIGYSNSTGTLGSGDVVIEADGELQFYRSSGNDMTVANDISGAGDLSLYGSDIVTLSGDSSYSGTTTIGSSSTLVVGSENGLGNSTVTSFSSGNLTFDSTTAITVDNDITGSVVVMQQGAGAVTLSGNNTYTGTTTVVTGTTLKAGSDTATGTGNMTLDGTFDLNGYDPTIGALNGSGVVTTTDTGLSTLTVGYGSAYGTFSGILQDGSGTLGLTKIGTNYQYLTGSNTYSGVTTISNGYLVIGYSNSTGTLGSGDVVIEADGELQFYRSSGNDMTVANDISGAGDLSLYGSDIVTLSGDSSYSGTTTIGSSSTLVVGSENGLGNSTVTSFSSGNLTFDSTTAITVDNDITGSVVVMQQGAGAVTLSGNNTYTGTTTVVTGTTLKAGSDTATGTGNMTLDGTFDLNGYDPTIGALNGSGVVTTTDTGLSTLTVGYGSAYGTFSGILQDGSGTLGLTKIGTNYQYLTGSNTYSGVTTISNGYLVIGYSNSTGTLGSGDVVIEADGELQFYRSSGNDMTVANDISGAGDLSLYGSDIVTLSGDSSYSGTTTIGSSSTLVVGSENGLGNSTVTSFSSGNLTFDSTTAITVDNDITGSVVVMQQGAGAVTLSGNNTYTGTTTVVTGTTLQVGSGGNLGSLGSGTVTNNGTLSFNRNDSLTVEVAISGTGDLVQQGTGTLVISNQCILDNATISSGTLQIEDEFTLNSSSDPLTNNGTFVVKGEGFASYGDTFLYGTAAVASGSEATISWSGLPTDAETYELKASFDGGNTYESILNVTNLDSALMVSGLPANTDCYMRIVAHQSDGSNMIYDGGHVQTPETLSDPGWFRITAMLPESSLTTLPENTYAPISTPGITDFGPENLDPPEVQIYPIQNFGPIDCYESTISDYALPAVDSFVLDNRWTYANSMQGAILQSLRGLVCDGSVPQMISPGVAVVYHIYGYGHNGANPYSFYSFDSGAMPPTGAYSGGHFCDPIDLIIDTMTDQDDDDPCEPCGDSSGGGSTDSSADPSAGSPDKETGNTVIGTSNIFTSTTTDGCSTCSGVGNGLTYSSGETNFDTGFGYGWSDVDELSELIIEGNTVLARFGAEETIMFDGQSDGSYVPSSEKVQEILSYEATTGLYTLTMTDGTTYEYFDGTGTFNQNDSDPTNDSEVRLEGCLYRKVSPDGTTIEVTDWDSNNNRVATVLDKTSPDGQAYQKREFTYTLADDGVYRVHTITLLEYNGTSWDNVRKITYDYYGTGSDNGLAGDLKSISTQQWDATLAIPAWADGDTSYFRYYTENDAENGAFKHGLKRMLLAEAYEKAEAYGAGLTTPLTVDELSETDIANFTCFYYEYDAMGRVTEREVFGESSGTSYTHAMSGNANGYNTWHRKTVETQLDGTTITNYTNYLGSIILSDLYDPTTGEHSIEYNRYDAVGRKILTTDTSAFVADVEGKYYDDETYDDLVGYDDGDAETTDNSPYLSDTDGLYQLRSYYDTTGSGAAEGYIYQRAVANGEGPTRLAFGETNGPIVFEEYDYEARTVGSTTAYAISSYTYYDGEASDGNDSATREYDYTWKNNSFQVEEITVTLPVVSTAQNGSGTSDTIKQWYDDDGNLAWTMDGLGRVTYQEYDVTTGRVIKVIEDIDGATVASMSLTSPTGWTLPTSDGINAITDYEYDTFGRVTKTLGPEHTADISGTPTSIRTATWTFYDDVNHETRYAQGYVVVSTSAETIVGPISITKTDRDGRIVEQVIATYSGTVSNLATAIISQADYTAWTTYQYTKTRLTSTRVYDDIPSSGEGTNGTNYELTTFGYESYTEFGETNQMGRVNKVVTSDGTITRQVYNYQGNVIEVWIGTDDTGATDDDPCPAGTGENDMVLVTSYTYDSEGRLISTTEDPGGIAAEFTTEYQYDWRGGVTDILTSADVVTHYEYDNQGQVILVETYASDDFTLASSELRAKTEYLYDALGQVYETHTYEVDPSTGTVGSYLTTESWYVGNRNLVQSTDELGAANTYEYDGLGRLTKITEPDPDGTGTEVSPWTLYTYDDANNLLSVTDRLGNGTTYEYDAIGRRIRETDANNDITTYTYTYVTEGYQTTLTDAEGNTTTWTYDDAGRAVEEENELGDSCYYVYDEGGHLVETTDRNEQVVEYTYDFLGNCTSEIWKDASDNTIHTFTYTYNNLGQLLTASDANASYEYDYDAAGRLLEETQDLTGLTPTIVLTYQYNDLGLLSQAATTIGGVDDAVTDYIYDGFGRLASIQQYGVTGGNAVAEKRIDYTYDDAGQWDTITRYADLVATDLVATGDYGYDLTGRLTSLMYTKGTTTLVGHAWAFNAGNDMTGYLNSIDNLATYTNDDAGQLTGVDYTNANIDDESYTYDDNGNRVTANGDTYTTGDNNQLTSDGTYVYTYDDGGNRTAKFVDTDSSGTISAGDTDITEYDWDYRNRLTTVTTFDDYTEYSDTNPDPTVKYTYDYANRLIGKTLDSDGDGTVDSSTVYVQDSKQIIAQFDKTGTGDAAASDLSHRYLWGEAVDQLLADETVDDLATPGDVIWSLVDHLGTTRDLAEYNAGTDTTTIANHRVFDAYGNLEFETDTTVDCLFGYTGRLFDEDTALQNNLNRWYDATVGRWLSEDPIRFLANDANLYRYVSNVVMVYTDPSGLDEVIVDDKGDVICDERGRWRDGEEGCRAWCDENTSNPISLAICYFGCIGVATIPPPEHPDPVCPPDNPNPNPPGPGGSGLPGLGEVGNDRVNGIGTTLGYGGPPCVSETVDGVIAIVNIVEWTDVKEARERYYDLLGTLGVNNTLTEDAGRIYNELYTEYFRQHKKCR